MGVEKFQYPEAFIKAVVEYYPTYCEMHELASTGSYKLGRWLDDLSHLSQRDWLDYIQESTSLDYLKNVARVYTERVELYKWWFKIVTTDHN